MKSFTEKIELFMNWNQSQSKIECLFERQEKKIFFHDVFIETVKSVYCLLAFQLLS